jgi:hypothetical protein
MATESTEKHGKKEHPLDMFSVFFCGFRGYRQRMLALGLIFQHPLLPG